MHSHTDERLRARGESSATVLFRDMALWRDTAEFLRVKVFPWAFSLAALGSHLRKPD